MLFLTCNWEFLNTWELKPVLFYNRLKNRDYTSCVSSAKKKGNETFLNKIFVNTNYDATLKNIFFLGS